jgi:hypothetical protein
MKTLFLKDVIRASNALTSLNCMVLLALLSVDCARLTQQKAEEKRISSVLGKIELGIV